jgi:aryl-alcohol dehydrogenase-like predicted oxidoreductase
VHPIAALQTEYSPWVRNPEIAVLETCRELGIAFVAFSPVGRGYFGDWIKSATYRDGDIRALMPRFLEPNFSRNLALLDPFREIAKGLGISCAQLAIAWTLERAPHIIALPGTVNEAHLAEDLEAAKLVLPEQAVTAIDAIFTPDAVSGTRYPPSLQATVSTEMFEDEQAQLATAD